MSSVCLKNILQKPLLSFFFPAAVILGVWHICAVHLGAPLILPSPQEVYNACLSMYVQPRFHSHLAATFFRSIFAFAVSFIISAFLGILSGLNTSAERFLRFPMSIIKAAPVVSFILLAVFWFSTNMVPVFVSVLMTLPVLTASFTAGILNTDKKLVTAAVSYGLSKKDTARRVYIPSLVPFMLSGSLGAFGLSWKVVVAAEVLCLPQFAAGSALYSAKVQLETADVFAVSIAVIFLSYVCETAARIAVRPLEKKYGY